MGVASSPSLSLLPFGQPNGHVCRVLRMLWVLSVGACRRRSWDCGHVACDSKALLTPPLHLSRNCVAHDPVTVCVSVCVSVCTSTVTVAPFGARPAEQRVGGRDEECNGSSYHNFRWSSAKVPRRRPSRNCPRLNPSPPTATRDPPYLNHLLASL